jgi:1-acyl-sn-glycerol-3-phosphate acyltransferase
MSAGWMYPHRGASVGVFLAKQEVGAWPIIGRLARLQGVLFVNRSRRMAIPALNQQIADRMAIEHGVVLFAKATTGDGNRILKFHSFHSRRHG